MRKVVITGAAGLVGQNLVARLKNRSGLTLVGIDKHIENVALFRRVHPEVEIILADLSMPSDWADLLSGVDAVIINQAQIGGLNEEEFVANNVTATKLILDAMKLHGVNYFVGISSSVVNSTADDFYARTKTAQEGLFVESGIDHVILRPTLMFGWFDRKHLGWLRRFMDRTPFFPIPGSGNFLRQPLYVGDFVSIIASCLDRRTVGLYDISGLEKISYGALIKLIHDIVHAKARIVHIPYKLFWAMLWIYARVDHNPPFTTRQLEALVIPEEFPVIDWPAIFGITATPLFPAVQETYLDPAYGRVVLAF